MDGEEGRRDSLFYPEVFPVSLSHQELPSSSHLSHSLGLPTGGLITPFIGSSDGTSLLQYNPKLGSQRGIGVARCDSCGGYINPFCDSTNMRWVCSLCETRNSFARHMHRYRQVDLQLLPEKQHLMLDFPLPLCQEDDSNREQGRHHSKQKQSKGRRKEKTRSKYHCPASERPAVHIFLIQESMPLDCLQAVVDAISNAITNDVETGMHPDIEVILLTFSNRIGIVRLQLDSDEDDYSESASSLPESPCLLPACIQYSHFSIENVACDSDWEEGGVFDGQTENKFTSLASCNSQHAQQSERVCSLLSLNEIAGFDDVRQPIGRIRNSLRSSLSALYDASPSVPLQTCERGLSPEENLHGPLMMLGPVLEEVVSWIIDIDSTLACGKDPTGASALHTESQENEQLGGLMGLLAGIGLVSSKRDTNEDDWIIGDHVAELASKRYTSPIDRCTGVQMHVMLSSPQDLARGCHDSVHKGAENSSFPSLEKDWVMSMAKKCANAGLGVNVWGIAPYEDAYSGLQDLLPLAQLTGGQLHRIVLGTDPATERLRFGLNLNRALTTQFASKCLLKLRTSKAIDASVGITGPLVPDKELPGIYRIASCSPLCTFGFNLQYNDVSEGDVESSHNRRRNVTSQPSVALQVAFSYSTLAEQHSDDDSEDDDSDVFLEETMNAVGFNIEEEYAMKACSNLQVQDMFKKRATRLRKERQRLIENSGSKLAISKYRRRQDIRGPLRYSVDKKLVAVRRLRVISVMVDCTPKIPRVIKKAHSGVMAVLVIRKSFLLAQESNVSDAVNYLMEWSVGILVGICWVIWKHKRQHHHNTITNNEPEDWDGGGKSYTGIEYPETPPEDRVDAVISEALSYAKIWRFLQVIYGAIHVLLIQVRFQELMCKDDSSDAGKLQESFKLSSTNSMLVRKSWGDSFAEIFNLVMTCDFYVAEKVLYPELVAIADKSSMVLPEKLALRRESLTTTGQTNYILDNGQELVLYRSFISPKKRAMFSKSLNNNSKEENASTLTVQHPPPPDPSHVENEHSSDVARDSSESADGNVEFDDPKWLANDLCRRMHISPFAPKAVFAEAGSLNSSFFTENLLDDASNVNGGYTAFIDDIRERTRRILLED